MQVWVLKNFRYNLISSSFTKIGLDLAPTVNNFVSQEKTSHIISQSNFNSGKKKFPWV